MNDAPRVQPATASEFRAWLEANHSSERAVWMVLWKKSSGREPVALGDAIDAALCFGWIDSKSQTVDQDRYEVYFSVRKPGSTWSKINKDKVERLTTAGLMRDAGRDAIERAKQDGSWTILDGPEAGIIPPDLAAAFESAPGARQGFEGLPERRRKNTLAWIALAKRETTRANRIEKTVSAAIAGDSPIG